MTYLYETKGTCSKEITFELVAGHLSHVAFTGGCAGNTNAITRLIEGMDAAKAAETLKGTPCGSRGTSCCDQLARAITVALKDEA
jgi:uncharacterized protein (TIGR03905 family)